MKDTEKLEAEGALLVLVRDMDVEVSDVVRFLSLARRLGRGSLRRAEKCLVVGETELRRRGKTVTFERAVEVALEDRSGRRKRTLNDLRYVARRFIKRCPGLAKRRVRTIRTEECMAWINEAFSTPSQRRKARTALSGIFSSAIRHGWCADNPVRRVPVPRVTEQRIPILTREEEERLMEVSRNYEGGICLPAVATMLYAGVRPHEVARLTWEQVHLDERVISILPEHSKTGGARHVTIQEPLAQVLGLVCQQKRPAATQKLCPPNWVRHWGELHRVAGWHARHGTCWRPDVLRHTFATRFLKVCRSYHLLQVEMGHRSSELLRTRYIGL